jgi:hypothetical protein
VADEIGICAVTVNASDLNVRDFYLEFESRPLLDDDLHLFLLMSTIRKTVERRGESRSPTEE